MIGRSKEAGQNQVMTHYQARRFLDARFVEVRERAILEFEETSPNVLAVLLEVLNRKWRAAVKKLSQARLPQKRRTHKYRKTSTVNRTVAKRPKTRPRDSFIFAEETGGRKPSRKRSHHFGEYHLRQPKRGRPKKSKEHHARKAKHRNAKRKAKRIAARLKAGKPLHRHHRKPSNGKIAAARLKFKIVNEFKDSKDHRSNHDKRYAYLRPDVPERRTGKEVASHRKPKKRHEGTGNPLAFARLLVRRIAKGLSRRRKLRAYWAKVKRESK